MTEVEELANKYFDEECQHDYADNEEQLREDVVPAYIKGYEKGEADEKFRTKQVVTKGMAELIKENEKLKELLSLAFSFINSYRTDNFITVEINGYANKDVFFKWFNDVKLLLKKGEIK